MQAKQAKCGDASEYTGGGKNLILSLARFFPQNTPPLIHNYFCRRILINFSAIVVVGAEMIKSVELRNWKTHLNSRFEFSSGTNVLIGQMGAGKTAVMDAICFALFGTFPALQQRRIALHEIIMARPTPMESATVLLVFQYGGSEFRVERTVRAKGSTEAKLFIDGKFAAGPKPADVNNAIERNIEINYNLFSRAVYSEQNQIDYFLRLSPGQRKEKFDELLGLDRYEVVRGNAVSALNRLRSVAEDKKKWLGELEREAETVELKHLEKKAAEKRKLLAELKRAEETQAKELLALKEKVYSLEKKEALFRELGETAARKRVLAEKLEEEIKEAGERLNGQGIVEIKRAIEKKQRVAQEASAAIAGLEKGEKELIEKASALRQEIRGNEAKIAEIGEQTRQIEKAGSSCPVCKTPLDESKRVAVAAENKKSIQCLLGKNRELLAKIAKIERQRSKKEEDASRRKGEKEKIEAEILRLGTLLDLGNTLAEKRLQLDGLKKELERIGKRLAELGFVESEAKEAREKLVRRTAEVETNKKEQLNAAEVLEGLAREIEKAKKRTMQIGRLRESVEAIGKNCEKLQLFTNCLLETQAQLRESLVETINEAMDSIWQRVYPYADYTSVRMAVEKGSYELVVRDQAGKWVRVEGILSGGERSAAAICIRIAFSIVLTRNLSWMILDEPTHNLDSAAVGQLGRMMREALHGLIEQVFVITHDKGMEKAASGSLYLLKRNKAVGSPTTVEPLALED
jgi:exonuclease SbcC